MIYVDDTLYLQELQNNINVLILAEHTNIIIKTDTFIFSVNHNLFFYQFY